MTTTDPANQPTSSSGWLAYAAPTTASDRLPSTLGQAPDGPEHWHVTTCVHEQLTDQQRHELFDAIADAAHEVEIGPDVHVGAAPCYCLEYALPAEPPEGTRLRGRSGLHWQRYPAGWSNGVRHAIGWSYLLATDSPLVPAPPAGTEAEVPDADT